jgi:hypothetical protein
VKLVPSVEYDCVQRLPARWILIHFAVRDDRVVPDRRHAPGEAGSEDMGARSVAVEIEPEEAPRSSIHDDAVVLVPLREDRVELHLDREVGVGDGLHEAGSEVAGDPDVMRVRRGS